MERTLSTSHGESLTRQLLTLAVPVTIGVMVQTCYHLVNAFWVGRVGADALAVVAIVFPVNLVIVSFASGLGLGGTILVAQRHGAGDHAAVGKLAAQTLSGVSILAVLISALGLLLSAQLPGLLGAPDTIEADAIRYLRITLSGSLATFLTMGFQNILRGVGEARAPLLVIIPSVALNALLDPLLIFGWGPLPALGVHGAAVATISTQVCTAAAGIWLMLRPRFRLNLRASDLWPDWKTVGKLLKLGIPASIEQSTSALSVSVMTVLITGFGTVVLASYGIVFRLLTFTIIPAMGMSMAVSILLGQRIGAGDTTAGKMVVRQALKVNLLMMALIGALLFAAAGPIAAIFAPTDAALRDYCALVLRFFALSYPFIGLQSALVGGLRGAGDTLAAMMISLFGVWALQVPLAFFLSQYTALQDVGLWWGCLLASGVNMLVTLGYYRTDRWLHKVRPG